MGVSLTESTGYKVDWLAFTIKLKKIYDYSNAIKKVTDYLGYDLSLFQETGGRYFYNCGLALGSYVNIYFNDPKRAGKVNQNNLSISFQFTGVGCTDIADRLEERYESKDFEQNWLKFLGFLKKIGAKFTRTDWALDIFTDKYFVLDDWEKYLKKGWYVSNKKTFNINRGSDQKGNSRGLTCYIGSMPKGGAGSSGLEYLRGYDKKAQFDAKGDLLPERARNSGFWQRLEIQFTKKHAEAVIEQFLKEKSFGSVYFGHLKGLISFVEPTKNRNGNLYRRKDKWKLASWWADFIEDVPKIAVGDSSDMREISLAELLRWIKIAVVPSLQLLEAVGEKKNFDIYQMIQSVDAPIGKKRKKIYYDSLAIPQETIDKYVRSFIGVNVTDIPEKGSGSK